MLKKWCISVLLGVLCAAPVCAQHWRLAAQKAQQAAQRASRALGEEGAYKKALQEASRLDAVEKAFARGRHEWFYKYFRSKAEWPREKSAAYALSNGWAIKSNQMGISRRIWWERRARELEARQQEVLSGLRMLELGTAEDWVSFIPADCKLIFLGEYHGKNIRHRVADLLAEYRRQHPHTQMILLTEFLPDSYPDFRQAPGQPHWYLRYFQEFLESQNIQFSGLEEIDFLTDHTFVPAAGPAGNSLAGVNARNAHWVQRIKDWQAKYPDAVFFVYAGGGHVGYEYPASVSLSFKNAFVFSFIPLPPRHAPELFYADEIFHSFTRGRFFRQGVIVWKSKRLARLAGFDVQILLRPEHLER